ncbi:MAG TPA: creatininase family protein [Euryarchaeota archaeon]|nr:creatinine amidohydrolase [archaeon BMS3Bbin16]HDH27781.1 creatininase family protein [Euryarchaeota archaeon]
MDLADMTWKGVEEYLKKRKDIILPFGAVEEHGYHLPLSTDGDIAIAVAEGLSKRCGVVVAPILWYGVCNTTRVFPGTITADFDSFKAYVSDLLTSLKNSGFQTVYIISGHLGGSHVSALKEAARSTDLNVLFFDLTKVRSSDILETMPFHACEAETSLMLHLHPEKVELARAVDEEIVFDEFSMTSSVKLTESGVWGSPSKASAEKGKRLFNRIIETFMPAIKGG